MFGLTCRLGAHISCYAHDTRLYPTHSSDIEYVNERACPESCHYKYSGRLPDMRWEEKRDGSGKECG